MPNVCPVEVDISAYSVWELEVNVRPEWGQPPEQPALAPTQTHRQYNQNTKYSVFKVNANEHKISYNQDMN